MPGFIAALAGACSRILIRLGRALAGRPAPDPAPFTAVERLVNRVAVGDEEVRQHLGSALQAMAPGDKDRLVEVLVMTLRCQAKRDLARRRALAVLGYRVSQVGDRMQRLGI